MSTDFAVQIIYNGVILILLLSAPAVGIGLTVGFIISLFQAVTQIQEQTLTFVPKVVAVLGMVAVTAPWIASLLIDFTVTLWANIPAMVR
ncbi:MAG: flagellar biosynthesis protein FliQ [bacterium]